MAQLLSEASIQSEFHLWLWNTRPETRYLAFAIPNGGKRDKIEAARLKAQGVVAGIPDYFISIPGVGADGLRKNGLYIEFKTPQANMNTQHVKSQFEVHDKLMAQNYDVLVCDSSEVAKEYVVRYLEGWQGK